MQDSFICTATRVYRAALERHLSAPPKAKSIFYILHFMKPNLAFLVSTGLTLVEICTYDVPGCALW